MPQFTPLPAVITWMEVSSRNFQYERLQATDCLWLPAGRQVARYWGDSWGVELLCAEGNGSDISVERFHPRDGTMQFALLNFWPVRSASRHQEVEMWTTKCPISLYYKVQSIKNEGGAVPDTLMAKLKELMEAPRPVRHRRRPVRRNSLFAFDAGDAAEALIQTERAR